MFHNRKQAHLVMTLVLIFTINSQLNVKKKISMLSKSEKPFLAANGFENENRIICWIQKQPLNSTFKLRFLNLSSNSQLKQIDLSTYANITTLSMSNSGKYIGFADYDLNLKIFEMNTDYTINKTETSIKTNFFILNIIFGNESLRQITYITTNSIIFRKQGKSIQFFEKKRITYGLRLQSFQDTYVYADLQNIWFRRKVNQTWEKKLMTQANAETIKMEKINYNNTQVIVWVTKASTIHFTFLDYENRTFQNISYTNITQYSKNHEIFDFDLFQNNRGIFMILSGSQVIQLFEVDTINSQVKIQILAVVNQTVTNIIAVKNNIPNIQVLIYFQGLDLKMSNLNLKFSIKSYYISINTKVVRNTIIVCNQKCQSCKDNQPDNCTSCVNGFSFATLAHDQCKICNIRYCSNCSNISKCNKCFANYYFTNNSNAQCIHCSLKIANCIQCIDENTCGTCNTSTSLFMGRCLICLDQHCIKCKNLKCVLCHSGWYLKNNYCKECIDPCSQCSSKQNNCTRCKNNLTASNGQCFCKGKYKYTQDQSICILCQISNCKACISDNFCAQCEDKFELTSNKTCAIKQNNTQSIKPSQSSQQTNSQIKILSISKFTIKIQFKVSSHLNTLTFYIDFNKIYKLQGTVQQIFTFFAANKQLQYSFHQQRRKALIIKATYNESLQNVLIDCKVNLSLVKSEKGDLRLSKSDYNLGLITSPFVAQSEKQVLQSISSVSKKVVSGTKLIASGLISMGGLFLLINFINFSQLISLYVILQLNYPSNLCFTLESLLELQTIGIYPTPSTNIFDNILDYDPLPTRIKQYGFHSNFIASNYLSIIIIISFYLIYKAIAVIIVPWIPSNCMYKILRKATVFKKYENFAIQFQASALTFIFSASLVIKNPFSFTLGGIFNLMLALIFYEGCLLYVFMNWAHLKNNYRNSLVLIDGCLMDLQQKKPNTYQFILFKTFNDIFIAGSIFILPVQFFIPIVIVWNVYLLYRITIVQVFSVCMFKYTRIISTFLFILFNCLFVIFYVQQKYNFLSLTLYWNLGYVGIGCILVTTVVDTLQSFVGIAYTIQELVGEICTFQQNQQENTKSKQIKNDQQNSQNKNQIKQQKSSNYQIKNIFSSNKIYPQNKFVKNTIKTKQEKNLDAQVSYLQPSTSDKNQYTKNKKFHNHDSKKKNNEATTRLKVVNFHINEEINEKSMNLDLIELQHRQKLKNDGQKIEDNNMIRIRSKSKKSKLS